jgi:purine-binding chemotaxis protein CheW
MSEKEGVASGEAQLVVFKLGEEEFGVNIAQVREIIKMVDIAKMPKSPEFVEGVINLRGSITTVMDLRKKLGIEYHDNGKDTRIIIIEVGNNTMGMIVDSVMEVLRMSREDIDTSEVITSQIEAEHVQGVGKLKERILILLDLNRVLTSHEAARLEQVREQTAAA